MNFLLVVSLLFAFFCGSTEYKRSISLQSESVVRPVEFVVKNFTGVNRISNSARSVSTDLTWEMQFNQTFYKPLVLVSETINWHAVKGQFCIRLLESILKMRVRSVRLQTSSLLTIKIMFGNSTDDWTFRRLRKKLFIGNCRVYHTPCSRQQKRRFRLRFLKYRSVKHLYDCHRQESALTCRLELTLNYLSQVFCFVALECVIMCETPRLFYGIIPLFECFMVAVLPVMLVSFQSSYKCFTLRTQGK